VLPVEFSHRFTPTKERIRKPQGHTGSEPVAQDCSEWADDTECRATIRKFTDRLRLSEQLRDGLTFGQ